MQRNMGLPNENRIAEEKSEEAPEGVHEAALLEENSQNHRISRIVAQPVVMYCSCMKSHSRHHSVLNQNCLENAYLITEYLNLILNYS
ncbi:hypothetical protein AVEN_125132-1 [Araneus ventricosus]|uniref:Uncharacterized protein n=1 Tax=Araneus ventricosus TaxID=182803 RepID=A0A4Y2RTU7_ARAVE|nr:hypothetical protein AVEN_125132-1 [Araneus ventricosus]